MSIFSRKQEISTEDFCRNFYETQILNPKIGEAGIDAMSVYAEQIKKSVAEADSAFADIDLSKLTHELIAMRFELFALAWTHKFISGKNVVAQSAFTKHYLIEKGREDIWEGMRIYNSIINGATIHWLIDLGKFNLTFNKNMRESLTDQNIKVAKELGISIDESIERANKRLWSESAWRQKSILPYLLNIFFNQLGINPDELNQEALNRLAIAIKGLYDGAKQSCGEVKIKS